MGEQDLNPRKHYYINPLRDWLKYIKLENAGVAVQLLQLKYNTTQEKEVDATIKNGTSSNDLQVKGLIPLLNIALSSAQNEPFVQATSEDNDVGERDCAGHEKKHMAQYQNMKYQLRGFLC